MNRANHPASSQMASECAIEVEPVLPKTRLFCGAKDEFVGILTIEEVRQKRLPSGNFIKWRSLETEEAL